MNDLRPATFDDFKRETGRGNVVPIVRVVPADLQTTVGAFLRLAHDAPYSFLLESVEGGAALARYTFLGASPEIIVRGCQGRTFVEQNGVASQHDAPVVEYLREHFRSRGLAARDDLPPLAGGCIGYLSYEAARFFESALQFQFEQSLNAQSDDQPDDAIFLFFRTLLAFDHVKQQILITSVVFTEEAQDETSLRRLYEAAVAETAQLAEKLLSAFPAQASERQRDAARTSEVQFTSTTTRLAFEAGVEKIKEYIRRGECYQAVLSQRFTAEISAAHFDVYRALRRTNPAPYMYFLRLGETSIVGASPEMLVRVREGELRYRPIAGTRPRGASAAEDQRLAEEMRRDAKEVAEHTMLVDLGRNDLGRVAEYGSVQVADLMFVERYAHVQHLVTDLRATLRADCDRFDALAACFPAGTVTGAPKIRAMEIVSELEPHPRGVYAGAILYADYANNLDSCIAIRTAVLRGRTAHVQAGGGDVADSIPALEYEETVNKARALMRAIEIAENGI